MASTERLTAQELPALVVVAAALTALAFVQGGYSSNTVAIGVLAAWGLAAAGLVTNRGFRALTPAALAAGGALVALAALSAVSMAWAIDAGRAFAASVRIAGYAGLFVAVVAWAPRVAPRAWLAAIGIAIATVGTASLAGRFDPSLFGGPDPGLYTGIPGSVGRLAYPIGYWNGLASLLALGVMVSVWWAAHGRSATTRGLGVAALPAYGLALYLTSSRGGIGEAAAGVAMLIWLDRRRATILAAAALGAAAGLVLAVIAHGQHDLLRGLDTSSARSEGALAAAATILAGIVVAIVHARIAPRAGVVATGKPWRPRVVVLAALAAVAILVVGFAKLDEPGTTASPGQRNLISTSGSGRYQFWGSALDAFSSNPVKGVGAGNWELYWNLHPRLPTVVHNAHSLYLETLAELGPMGLALLAAFLALAGWAGWRRVGRQEPEAGVLLAVLVAGALGAGVDWTFQLPAVFAPVIVVAAVLLAKAPADAAAGPRSTGGRTALFAVALAAWIAVWAAGTTLATNAHLSSSHDDAAKGDLAGAAAEARDAAGLEPFSQLPRLQLALVEQAAGNYSAAAADAGAAVDLASEDWKGWLVASRIAADAGHAGKADAYFRVAEAFSPVTLPQVGSVDP